MSEPEWELLTVLFADIRGYTTFADRATARAAAEFLRGFFDVVIPIVRSNGGEVNQLLGDGLLAVFRTPDHADCALRAGAAMIAEAPLSDRRRPELGTGAGGHDRRRWVSALRRRR